MDRPPPPSTYVLSCYVSPLERNWDGAVGIATGYGLEGRGSIPARGKRFSPLQSGSESHLVLSNWYGGSFPGVKLTSQLLPKSRRVELYLQSSYVFMAWCLLNEAQGQPYLSSCLAFCSASSRVVTFAIKRQVFWACQAGVGLEGNATVGR
jgi:hypothetical protein